MSDASPRSPRAWRAVLPTLVLLAIAAVLAVVFRQRLIAWFTGGDLGGGGSSAAARVTAGTLAIDASVSPDPPRQSGNRVRVEVHDQAGAAIDGATVSVTYDMPAMGAMQEMKGTSTAKPDGAGVYTSTLDLPGGGTYMIEVRVESKKGAATARYNLTVGSPGLAVLGGSGGSGAKEASPPSMPDMPMPGMTMGPHAPSSYSFPADALAALRRSFSAYEQIRSALAHDGLTEIATPVGDLGAAVRVARAAAGAAPATVLDHLASANAAITALASAKDLDTARLQFGELSRALQSLAVADPRLASGWHVFECPMAPGYQGWFQKSPDLENPYMGTKSPTCGGASHWEGPGTAAATTPAAAAAPDDGNTITVDESRRTTLGIRTGTATRAPMTLGVRAVGRLTFDQTKLADVTVRVSGYITKLRVNALGQAVRKGETLFTFYSPELYAAQQECLFAMQRAQQSGADPNAPHKDALLLAAEKKLRLWGFDDAQMKALYARGEPLEEVPFPSPASGVVTEKDVVEGDAIQAGMRLFRIAALDVVWVEADVYEGDLARITKGQHAKVELTYLPGHVFDGTVAFIYPYLDPASRTGRVRVQLPNHGLELKPDMYATVWFQVELGERLQVPKAAIVYTGPRRIVFVDLGGGKLAPRDVTVGAETADTVEIVDGLREGDRVVTSGNFLVASESRIRSASFWENAHDAK